MDEARLNEMIGHDAGSRVKGQDIRPKQGLNNLHKTGWKMFFIHINKGC